MMAGYENITLEKGMYHVPGKSFTQVLEELDSSENYRGTPLEGLDAFQRQLKRYDIKVSGSGASPVEQFFSASGSAALFPEYVARAVRQGMERGGKAADLAAAVTVGWTIAPLIPRAATGKPASARKALSFPRLLCAPALVW